MSGTSQSAAVVSGVAALLLEAEPNLTPDQLKCKLMSTARPIMNTDGVMAFSVFQQGAGMVDGYAAVHEGAYNCANQGMDIDLDLAGIAHYGGPANLDEDGNFYIADVDGYLWRGPGVDGYLWGGRFVGSNGYLWGGRIVGNDGYLWSGRSFIDGYLWRNPGIDGYLWSGGPLGSASINVWVEQE
jgi:subtilisin family serine protease